MDGHVLRHLIDGRRGKFDHGVGGLCAVNEPPATHLGGEAGSPPILNATGLAAKRASRDKRQAPGPLNAYET
jgi:hypothetical protein